MRLILKGNRYTKISDVLRTLEWLDVNLHAKLQTPAFLYLLLGYFTQHITYTRDIHSYETRQMHELFVNSTHKRQTVNIVFNKGLKLYNKLPLDLRNASNAKIFKCGARQAILD